MAGVTEELWSTEPRSREVPERRRPMREVVAAPPGLAFNLLVAVVVTFLVLTTGTPGVVFGPFLMLVAALFVLGAIWFVRLCLYAGVRPPDPPFSSGRGLVVAPVLVLVAGGLMALDVPVRVGFEISRADLQAAADRVLAEPVADGGPSDHVDHPDVRGRLGLYEIVGSRRFPNGIVMFESNGAFMNDAGFAYFPDGNLPAGDGSFESPDFRALGGGWYAFTSSW